MKCCNMQSEIIPLLETLHCVVGIDWTVRCKPYLEGSSSASQVPCWPANNPPSLPSTVVGSCPLHCSTHCNPSGLPLAWVERMAPQKVSWQTCWRGEGFPWESDSHCQGKISKPLAKPGSWNSTKNKVRWTRKPQYIMWSLFKTCSH